MTHETVSHSRHELRIRKGASCVRQAGLQPRVAHPLVLEDLKLRQIADILEIPEGTVNSRIAEGLARLTRLLEPQFREASPRAKNGPATSKEP